MQHCPGHTRLRAQMRLPKSRAWAQRGHRSALTAAIAVDALVRKTSSESQCPARTLPKAASMMLRHLPENLDIVLSYTDRRHLRYVSQISEAGLRRSAPGCDRREPAGTHSRLVAYGDVEQVWGPRADDRKQVRDRGRILHALRRHVRRPRRHLRRPKTLVYRLARYVNSKCPVIPESTLEKPPLSGIAPRPERQRLAAAVRRSRYNSRSVRGGQSTTGINCRRARL